MTVTVWRSDFQEGSAHTLYRSITEVLFKLPNDSIVYPGHDYNGRAQSSIDEAVPANLRCGCPEGGKLPPEPDLSNIQFTYAGVPEVDRAWLENHSGEVALLDVRLRLGSSVSPIISPAIPRISANFNEKVKPAVRITINTL